MLVTGDEIGVHVRCESYGISVDAKILMIDKFAPGILAVIEGRMTGAEAYLACMKDDEAQSEDSPPEPVVLDVIEHKFDRPRDAESELRRRRRRGW